MPPRVSSSSSSSAASNRLSAVYIGTAYNIPDLPDPPDISPPSSPLLSSPRANSHSGLPSPPATNSTGSGGGSGGSNADVEHEQQASAAASLSPLLPSSSSPVSVRHKHNSSITSVSSIGSISIAVQRGTSILEEREPVALLQSPDEDDDLTAKFSLNGTKNHSALQRATSLAQRNRLVLDKLSGKRSPAPSTSSAHSHSSSASVSSHSTPPISALPISNHSISNSNSGSPSYDPRSGSETERESTYSRASTSTSTSTTSSRHQHHQRALSYAESTSSSSRKERSHASGSASGSGSSGRRRKRRSAPLLTDGDTSSTAASTLRERERGEYVNTSTRRRGSPTNPSGGSGGRRRAALPAEFRRTSESPSPYTSDPRPSPSPSPTPYSHHQEPQTPLRAPAMQYTTSSSSSASTSQLSRTSHTTTSSRTSNTGSRYSLDLERASQSSSRSSHSHSQSVTSASAYYSNGPTPRSGSKTHHSTTSTSTSSRFANNRSTPTDQGDHSRRTTTFTPPLGMSAYRERRQTLRGGSAESALSGNNNNSGRRTLIGEGLRAAGLSPTSARRNRRVGRLSLGWEEEGDASVARELGMRMDEAQRGERERGATLGRAVTSLAHYSAYRDGAEEWEREDRDERDESRRLLRGSRSAAGLLRDASRTRDREERDRDREREYRDHERDRSLARERDRGGGTPDRDRDRDRDREQTISHTSYALTRLSRNATGTPSPFGSRRNLNNLNLNNTPGGTPNGEHTKLLQNGLSSFEASVSRAAGAGELVRNAQSVVAAAARVNEMLRYGAAKSLEEQVRAEVDGVDGGTGGGEEMREVWKQVGAEYRDGVKASDELVRGLTSLLLEMGRSIRDLASNADGGGGGVIGGSVHSRSVSLDEEGLRRRGGSMSPDVSSLVPRSATGPGSSGGGSASASVSGSGRRSVESRMSWEPNGHGGSAALRDDVSRRLAAVRAESALGGARPSSAFSTLRDRNGTSDTPPVNRGAAGTPSGTTRRLFMPREQRELQMTSVNANNTPGSAGPMPTINSQETFYGEYEASPTPASRSSNANTHERTTTLDRSRTLALPPKPLPSLPSESLRRNQTVSGGDHSGTPSNTIRDRERDRDRERERDRRKPSIASITTIRGVNTSNSNSTGSSSSFPAPVTASLTTPSSATTAVTPHTVSTLPPDRTTFPALPRTDSDRSVRSSVTFSRPSAVSSVSALTGVRQQDNQRQRQRTESGGKDAPLPTPSPNASAGTTHPPAPPLRETQSGSETERPPPRRLMQTLGGRAGARMSLDGVRDNSAAPGRKNGGTLGIGHPHPAERSAAAHPGMGPPMNTAARKERRRTVTDIWPQE